MRRKPTIAPRKPPPNSAAAQKFLASVPDDDRAVAAEPSVDQVAEVHPLKVERPEVQTSKAPTDDQSAAGSNGRAGRRTATAPTQPSGPPKARKRVFTRVRDGRQVRQTTVYLDVDLAKQLAYHCVDTDLDQSQVIGAALRTYLRSVD